MSQTHPHVARFSIQGNPNIGLNAFVTDTFAIVGRNASDSDLATMESVLKVPVLQASVCGTSLCGIFLAGTQKEVFIPSVAFDEEIAHIRQFLAKHGANLHVVKTKFTALGNNFLIKDDLVLANHDVEKEALEFVRMTIGAKVAKHWSVADTDVVGSSIVFTKAGALVHPNIPDEDMDELEDLLGLPCIRGTVNWGSPYVRSGIICNKNGFLVGTTSSGPEITNADRALGFLQESH